MTVRLTFGGAYCDICRFSFMRNSDDPPGTIRHPVFEGLNCPDQGKLFEIPALKEYIPEKGEQK